jgi:hypothetical protein
MEKQKMSKRKQYEKENLSQEVRRVENGTTQGNLDPNREGGDRNLGKRDGDFSGRTTGEDWARSVVAAQFVLTGGIVTRLIRQAEQRLQEHEDCIIWYQDQKQKDLEELDELRSLQKHILETQGDEAKDEPD